MARNKTLKSGLTCVAITLAVIVSLFGPECHHNPTKEIELHSCR